MAEPVCSHFNPRTPCGVRPRLLRATEIRFFHFNPRTPCGVRRRIPRPQLAEARFQSTHPLRGATHIAVRRILHELFQSTHPLRGATLTIMQGDQYAIISIHAPLAGCDRAAQFVIGKRDDFNPRTPCGVRQMSCSGNSKSYQFQSTHPLRGATHAYDEFMGYEYISIHAPLAGCDCRILLRLGNTAIFQSTHPLRGATVFGNRVEQRRKFQSTHPLRGATYICVWSTRLPVISIHAPLAGCDDQHYTIDRLVDISIHAPLAGCDENY